MVWDMTGAGPSNWDLSMIRFIISSYRNYFPAGLKYLVLYGVPWIMNAFVKIAMKLMPEESQRKVKFLSKEQLFECIDPQNIPDFIGGTATKSYKEIPKGVRDAKDMAEEKGFTLDEVENVLKYYEKELK